jgi:hypothetical protein
MFRVALASIALVAGLGAAPAPPAPAAFSLLLESSADGAWAARCDSGCRWRELSFRCERACGAVIDANGLVTLATAGIDSSSFRFIVERSADEVRATARNGTAWQTLTWSCTLDPCRVRVDAFGVSGIARAQRARISRKRESAAKNSASTTSRRADTSSAIDWRAFVLGFDGSSRSS